MNAPWEEREKRLVKKPITWAIDLTDGKGTITYYSRTSSKPIVKEANVYIENEKSTPEPPTVPKQISVRISLQPPHETERLGLLAQEFFEENVAISEWYKGDW